MEFKDQEGPSVPRWGRTVPLGAKLLDVGGVSPRSRRVLTRAECHDAANQTTVHYHRQLRRVGVNAVSHLRDELREEIDCFATVYRFVVKLAGRVGLRERLDEVLQQLCRCR